MKNKVALLILIFFVMGLVREKVVYSATDEDVVIDNRFNFDDETGVLTGQANISYINRDLFNSNVKFSFHIYDENGECLVYETVRYPFEIDDKGIAQVDYILDLSTYFDTFNKKILKVCPDLVDEENLYWYADNKHIGIKINPILCEIKEKIIPVSIIVKEISREDNCYRTQLEIDVSNESFTNDSLKLSYHVYDLKGELLFFEGERAPLCIQNGSIELDMYVDISQYIEQRQSCKIVFDIVDEVNGFWFSKNEEIALNTDEVIYKYDFLDEAKLLYQNVIFNQPIQLSICLLAMCFLVYGINKIMRTMNVEKDV